MSQIVSDEEMPIVSVIIATYNSSRIISRTLDSIVGQNYPKDKLEIIGADGGSTDNTRSILNKYGAVILDNPKGDVGNAKMIGREYAHGSYMLYMDHDEAFVNPNSIRNRIMALVSHPECKIALCTGYKRPKDYSGLNEYLSEFGDPFSLYYYHCSYHYRYYTSFLKNKASSYEEYDNFYVFDLEGKYSELIVELGAGGLIFEKNFFSTTVNWVYRHEIYSYAFYDMMQAGYTKVIVSKDDAIEHYSVDSLKSYLPKLRWRIINNVHLSAGKEYGFEGRSGINGKKNIQFKKYFFPLYSLSIIVPVAESVYLSISRKNAAYLLHFPLCLYVTFYIIFQFLLKILRVKPRQLRYDGSK